MQQSANRFGGTGQKTRIADLRAQVNSASVDARKPPKPRKAVKRDTEEERALKAERLAMAQHKMSLMGDSKKPYKRPGEREERKSGGLFFQLILVMVVAGGVALALDPSIIPAEWICGFNRSTQQSR